MVAEGRVDVAVCGGSEALSRVTLSGFNSLRAVDPEFCRPFHKERVGLTLGEGAVFFILERARSTAARGGRLQFTVRGAGASCDAHHMTQPDPDGRGAERAMGAAFADSGIDPDAIALVETHGTATPHNDLAESHAIARVFSRSSRPPAITAVKGNIGHTLGAAGAFGVFSAASSLAAAVAPPIAGTARGDLDPDCAPLDYVVDGSRAIDRGCALINSFAFGGNDVSVVIAGGRS